MSPIIEVRVSLVSPGWDDDFSKAEIEHLHAIAHQHDRPKWSTCRYSGGSAKPPALPSLSKRARRSSRLAICSVKTLKAIVRSSRVFGGHVDLAHASGSNRGRGSRKSRVYSLLIGAFA